MRDTVHCTGYTYEGVDHVGTVVLYTSLFYDVQCMYSTDVLIKASVEC